MAFNPMNMMKIKGALTQFSANHPKFVAFLRDTFATGIPADSIIELTVTKPGANPVTTNIKITQSDLELLEQIKELSR
ncbi:hypothetical protein [Lachnospira multipara]|jgi:hypothetical protein|uniref:hypothetical protein n=1 Tax=Lachnospira multipara TaxID=28051 RepID=UPI000A93B8D7|nr:hypothetical protein [Lachnospira multipara]